MSAQQQVYEKEIETLYNRVDRLRSRLDAAINCLRDIEHNTGDDWASHKARECLESLGTYTKPVTLDDLVDEEQGNTKA